MWRDAGITVLIMALCTGICAGLGKIWWENPLILLLYGVAVFLTAYCTEGFRFGTAAALLSMALLRVLFMDTLWPTLSGLAVDLLIGLCLFLLSFLTGCLKENRKQWAQQREQAKLFHVLYEEFYAVTKRGLYGSAALIKEENEKANDSSEKSIALTHEENARRMRAELAMITLGRYSEAIGMDNEEIKSYLR